MAAVESNAAADTRRIQKVLVLGGGTAGLLAALALRRHLPALDITIVRSTKLGVIGVGEGTLNSIVRFLHRYIGIDPLEFHRRVRPSIKLGIHYLWGKRDFFNYSFSRQLTSPTEGLPLAKGYYCDERFDYADLLSAMMMQDKVCLRRIDGRVKFTNSFSYHLENGALVAYLEELTDTPQFRKIDDLVRDVEYNDSGVSALKLESGQRVEADLFVDCSGFRAELIGGVFDEEFVDFSDALFCDRAIAGGWKRTDEPYHPYTTAETMSAGWCWRIEHDEVVNRGYVYSSAFLDDDAAEREYRTKCPQARDPRVLKFRSGVRRRTWVKNVVAMGNAAGFVEPLEATAIGATCDAVSLLVRALQASDNHVIPIQRDIYNRVVWEGWEMIRNFLAVHYKFNTRLDTPFWRAAQSDTQLGQAAELVEYYQAVGPDFRLLNFDLKRDFFSTEGYFAMLVGQGVPYRRQVEIGERERQLWATHKRALAAEAATGMSMTECLTSLRTYGLPESPAWGFTNADMVQAELGELQWQSPV